MALPCWPEYLAVASGRAAINGLVLKSNMAAVAAGHLVAVADHRQAGAAFQVAAAHPAAAAPRGAGRNKNNAMKPSLSPEDHLLLANRIRQAEKTTRGEIYCVVARQSDPYIFPAAFMLALGVLVASLAVAFWLDRSWLPLGHLGFVFYQIAALAAALLVLRLVPGLAIWLTPRQLCYRRAHNNAVRQFLAHNVHRTEKRTGIVIFVSLRERYATVIADAGIEAKVPQSDWNEIVTRIVAAAAAGQLTKGLADAIDRAGVLLAQHFPGGTYNPNELEDHVIEI